MSNSLLDNSEPVVVIGVARAGYEPIPSRPSLLRGAIVQDVQSGDVGLIDCIVPTAGPFTHKFHAWVRFAESTRYLEVDNLRLV